MASSNAAKRNAETAVPPRDDVLPEAASFEPGLPPSAATDHARMLQQRLHEAYAPALAQPRSRELSPLVQLAIIVSASGSLWALIGMAVRALV